MFGIKGIEAVQFGSGVMGIEAPVDGSLAGEPCASICLSLLLMVYPRVGGGTEWISRVGGLKDGLSPRGRGNLYVQGETQLWIGSILFNAMSRPGLSPRGRGNLLTMC